jgi:XRE family aerobic/anaerobic benzoate catabolism transcriptional regulator
MANYIAWQSASSSILPSRLRHSLLASLGSLLRSARASHGGTQAELAKKAGLSPRFLADLEAGRANVSLIKLAQVAAALDLSLGQLVGDAERDARGEAPVALTRTIALVGLRGAGKSTVGKAAAAALGVQFVELDRVVEERAALSLQNLFEIHGDEYFRSVESDALDDVLARNEPCVVATGGSLVMHDKTWSRLLARTTTVWLRATPAEHYARVQAQGDLRPMSGRPHAMTELRRLLGAREPRYKRAHFTIDTSHHTVAESVDRVVQIAARASRATS